MDVSNSRVIEDQRTWEIEYPRVDGQLVSMGPFSYDEALTEWTQMREIGVRCSLPRPYSSDLYVCRGES